MVKGDGVIAQTIRPNDVMPSFRLGIHEFAATKLVDAKAKPWHDGVWVGCAAAVGKQARADETQPTARLERKFATSLWDNPA